MSKLKIEGTLTCKGKSLTDEEEKIFNSFLESLKGSSIVYRGLDDEYLKHVYNEDISNLLVLSDHLFLFGEKGKIFWHEFKFEYDFNNTDEICFKSILKALKETFKYENNDSSVNRRMPDFERNNCTAIEEIISYDEQTWCEKIGRLSEKAKRNVKDYYISFLHTVGKAGYGNYSYFLSTTKKRTQAERFRHWDAKTGIIIVGWTNDKRIKCVDCHNLKKIVSNYGFRHLTSQFTLNKKKSLTNVVSCLIS